MVSRFEILCVLLNMPNCDQTATTQTVLKPRGYHSNLFVFLIEEVFLYKTHRRETKEPREGHQSGIFTLLGAVLEEF